MRIKEILKEKNLTAKEVSIKSGIAEAVLSNVANRKGNPSLQTLEKIAGALGVSLAELFADSGSIGIKCPHCGGALHVRVE